jgi:hypothetical protein
MQRGLMSGQKPISDIAPDPLMSPTDPNLTFSVSGENLSLDTSLAHELDAGQARPNATSVIARPSWLPPYLVPQLLAVR